MSVNPTVQGKGDPLAGAKTGINLFFALFGLFPRNKTAGLLLWLGSTYTTALLFASISASGFRGFGNILGYSLDFMSVPFISAVVAQIILTAAESPFWTRNEKNVVTVLAMLLDVGIVAAAVYPFTKNFGSSTIWTALVDAFDLNPEWGGAASIALAVVLGIIGAAGPEKLWNSR